MLSRRIQSSDAVYGDSWQCVSDAPPSRMVFSSTEDEDPAPARETVSGDEVRPASFVMNSWDVSGEMSKASAPLIRRLAPRAYSEGLLVSGLIDFLHSYGLLFGSAAGFQDRSVAWRGRPNLSCPAQRAPRKLRPACSAGSFLSGVTTLLDSRLTASPSFFPIV